MKREKVRDMKKRNKTLLTEREKKVSGIFNPNFLRKIKQGHFSGRLNVIWHEGNLEAFNLSSRLIFRKRRRKNLDDFDDDFDFFGDDSW